MTYKQTRLVFLPAATWMQALLSRQTKSEIIKKCSGHTQKLKRITYPQNIHSATSLIQKVTLSFSQYIQKEGRNYITQQYILQHSNFPKGIQKQCESISISVCLAVCLAVWFCPSLHIIGIQLINKNSVIKLLQYVAFQSKVYSREWFSSREEEEMKSSPKSVLIQHEVSDFTS